jgi:hypothetical protein
MLNVVPRITAADVAYLNSRSREARERSRITCAETFALLNRIGRVARVRRLRGSSVVRLKAHGDTAATNVTV